MPIAKITSKGQVTLPQGVRHHLHLEAGDRVEFNIEEDGTVRLRSIRGSVRDLFGFLKRSGQPPMAPVEVEEMNASISEFHAREDQRVREGGS